MIYCIYNDREFQLNGQSCGWLKDKFGMSWQIVPSILPELMKDAGTAGPVMKAFLKMKKFDIEKLKEAAK